MLAIISIKLEYFIGRTREGKIRIAMIEFILLPFMFENNFTF